MSKTEQILWIVWFILVVIWNYGFPEASPFLDVSIEVLLSFLNLIIIKTIKKK